MRWISLVRIVVVLFTLLSTWYFAENILSQKWEAKSLRSLFDNEAEESKDQKKSHNKCGNEKKCPEGYAAFKMISGAANVVGPTICLEDHIIMSSVKNNIGRGLNVAFINATTLKVIKTGFFDMYSGDIKALMKFFEGIKEGTLVLVASYDDPATKLDSKARDLFASLGSSIVKKLGFRDSWLFIGGKGIKNKTPFEQYIKNDKETNKYDGWPEVLEMEGCIPLKMG